jgi:murein L,D-transpeptidase YafK
VSIRALRRTACVGLTALALTGAPARAADGAADAADAQHPEVRLSSAIAAMQDGRDAIAGRLLAALIRDEPNFRLAHLLHGQVLALRSGARIGSPLADEEDPKLRDLLAEFRQRRDGMRALPAAGLVPAPLLKLSAELRHALVVDLGRGRAYLLENDGSGLRVIRNLYAGIGRSGFGKQSEGDLRTPVGIYRITHWLPDEQLPPLYGAGALPLSYPNSWDRALGRTGSGIWLHGVPPENYVRAPRSSEGCVTFSNADLAMLRRTVSTSATPVVLADALDWVPASRLANDRGRIEQALERWRDDWSTLDTEAYLTHYAADFRTDDGMDKATFGDYKRRVNAGKRRVEIRVSDLSLFAYPGEPGLVVAQFLQNYVSDNFASSSRKDQYWRRQANGDWKIVREMNR